MGENNKTTKIALDNSFFINIISLNTSYKTAKGMLLRQKKVLLFVIL